jgi:sugar/nucleoside kinase (ribokinase family)
MQEFDFISIGYVATDNFIELLDAEVKCEDDKENCTITIPFAQKIPFKGSVLVPAVGNAANAAMSANRLGLLTAFVSNIGDDRSGRDDLDAFQSEGVDTRFITVHKDKKTNYHYVLLYKGERTILINHESFPFTFPDIGKPKWLYLSSFSNESPEFYGTIIKYLESNPGVRSIRDIKKWKIFINVRRYFFVMLKRHKKFWGSTPTTYRDARKLKFF